MRVDVWCFQQRRECCQRLGKTKVAFISYVADFNSIETGSAGSSRDYMGEEGCIETVEYEIGLERKILDSGTEAFNDTADVEVEKPVCVVLRGLF